MSETDTRPTWTWEEFEIDNLEGQQFGELRIMRNQRLLYDQWAVTPLVLCWCSCGQLCSRPLVAVVDGRVRDCGCQNQAVYRWREKEHESRAPENHRRKRRATSKESDWDDAIPETGYTVHIPRSKAA